MDTDTTSIDINQLSMDEAAEAGKELGKQLGLIANEAAEKMNALLKVYSVEAKLAIQLIDLKTGNVLE